MISQYSTPDTIRGRRGFAVKFYTEDGTWDLVGSNIPTFFVRDAMMYMNYIHSQMRNPVTNIRDSDMIWDFFSLRPESTYHVMTIFGESGIPDGYRQMNGYGINVFKMVNAEGEVVYVKFTWTSEQDVKNLSTPRAANLTSLDMDYATRDLYNAIERGNYPSWVLSIQVMTVEEANRYDYNPFDSSREWPDDDWPLIPVGRIVLKKNPENYFAEVEQIAFNPAHLIPGIEPSLDRLLQSRLLVYGDAQRYRLGVNFLQLPVNRPFKKGVTNYQRFGQGTMHSQEGTPVYYPNSYNGPQNVPSAAIKVFHVSGEVGRYNTTMYDNMDLATKLWNSLHNRQKEELVKNIASSLGKAEYFIQKRQLRVFLRVHPDFAQRIKINLDCV